MSYVRVCTASELPDDSAIRVEVEGTPIVVARSEGEVFALYDECSHAQVALSEGEVYDGTVECWLHGSCFDLHSGKPTALPATKPVATYPVKIDDGDIFVALDPA